MNQVYLALQDRPKWGRRRQLSRIFSLDPSDWEFPNHELYPGLWVSRENPKIVVV